MAGLTKALLYLFLVASLTIAFAYTWLGTGMGEVERRLPRRVMGFYGMYGRWPVSLAEMERTLRSRHLQSLRESVGGRAVRFEPGKRANEIVIVVDGALPFSGKRFPVNCDDMLECKRYGSLFYEPPPEPIPPGELPPSARWM